MTVCVFCTIPWGRGPLLIEGSGVHHCSRELLHPLCIWLPLFLPVDGLKILLRQICVGTRGMLNMCVLFGHWTLLISDNLSAQLISCISTTQRRSLGRRNIFLACCQRGLNLILVQLWFAQGDNLGNTGPAHLTNNLMWMIYWGKHAQQMYFSSLDTTIWLLMLM